jgi:F0F1-type ATP synthase membrane subunit b/b'
MRVAVGPMISAEKEAREIREEERKEWKDFVNRKKKKG